MKKCFLNREKPLEYSRVQYCRVTNLKVLRRIGKDKEVIRTIKTRKLRYFGFVMRKEKYNILYFILRERYVERKAEECLYIHRLHNVR